MLASLMPPTPVNSLPLEACLELETMRELLQQALPDCAGGRVTIERLRIVHARRNASRRRNPNPLTLRYQLDVRNTGTGRGDTREFYGKVYRDGASADAVHGSTALHVPAVDMLLWAWPADPGLPQLPHLLDPNQTLRWWGESAHDVSALRYEPEQRATLRYTLNTADGRAKYLYAKTFRDDRAEAIFRRFAYFWHLARHDVQAPTVAQPLGYRSETHSFWQAPASGMPLSQGLTGASAGSSAPVSSLPQRLAHAIAALHAAPRVLAGPRCRDTAHWLNEVRRRRDKITRVTPELADRVARVTMRIEQTAVLLPASPLTLIHGDCHPEQMWVDGGRIVLFDFDEFALGDPMEDLAAFVTRLEALRPAPEFIPAFLAAYGRIAPERYCAFRLHWHRAVQQLLQASRAFVFQVSDWRGEVERRLAVVEALCTPSSMRAWQ